MILSKTWKENYLKMSEIGYIESYSEKVKICNFKILFEVIRIFFLNSLLFKVLHMTPFSLIDLSPATPTPESFFIDGCTIFSLLIHQLVDIWFPLFKFTLLKVLQMSPFFPPINSLPTPAPSQAFITLLSVSMGYAYKFFG
uniref:Uncharacterized protein n=1 Tax=Myotis myotis TaxID=51298 RepID=A0A7J7UPJ4_MYOMY|nr:hypothetical protein mMyoMyo1_008624 [Myotis myotis]